MEPILPCLKEARWGSTEKLARPLWRAAASPHMPWVGFGYDRPHSFEFLGRDSMAELGRYLDDIEREAVVNLGKRSASWQPTKVKLGFFKRLTILACGDDFLAAERILDTAFMREAQRQLQARGLLVGIPRRGLLLAIDGEQGVKGAGPFATMVSAQFHGGESAPISPAVFGMKDGEIVGVVGAAAEVGRSLAEEEEDGEAPYIGSIVTKDPETGLESVRLVATGEDFDKLAQGVLGAVAAVANEHGSRPEFSGEVRVILRARWAPELAKENVVRLEAHLQGLGAEVGPLGTGRPLRFAVEYRPSAF